MISSDKEFFFIQEVADFLRVNHQMVRKLINSGKLAASQPNGKWLIHRDDLQELLDRTKNTREGGNE